TGRTAGQARLITVRSYSRYGHKLPADRRLLRPAVVPEAQVSVTERSEEQLATLLAQSEAQTPSELFGDVSDDFWLWINTEGYRRSSALRDILPALPPEEIQRHWTFRTGDDTLTEGFGIYLLVRDLYQRNVGNL